MKLITRAFVILGCLMFFAMSLAAQVSREDGMDLYRQGKYDQAITILETVLTKDRSDQVAWVYLGACFWKSGNKRDALLAFSKGKPSSKTDEFPGYEKRVEITAKPRADFPHSENLQYGATKIARVAIELLSDGHVGFIVPIQAWPDGFSQNAGAAAKHIKFNPAKRDGKPVTSVIIVEYAFSAY
jgi:hypothetical protein